MFYSLEDIYRTVGKDDKVSTITFKDNSESCARFGAEATLVFIYTQREREALDKQIATNSATHGMVRAKVLFFEFSKESLLNSEVEEIEFKTEDIEDVFFMPYNLNNNTFHSAEKRTINKIEIEVSSLPDGGDWDWFYGFEKMRVEEKGIILSPEEQYRYLALKLFYEPQNLTPQEKTDIFVTEKELNEYVGFYYYKVLEDKGHKVSNGVIENLKKLFYKRINEKSEILNKYLIEAGSSFKKLTGKDPTMASKLFMKLLEFRQRRLNTLGRYPIYMDEDSYLHIFTRHVEDFKFNSHYDNKDNFQWFEEDVIIVMKKVIELIDEEYQAFRNLNPNKRFSKYGNENIYFEGDYYTVHIEETGRIDTFHKNKKADKV